MNIEVFEDDLTMTFEIARVICEMSTVCHENNVTIDNKKIVFWIFESFPVLKEEFEQLKTTSIGESDEEDG